MTSNMYSENPPSYGGLYCNGLFRMDKGTELKILKEHLQIYKSKSWKIFKK